jgi:hypothetical protein
VVRTPDFNAEFPSEQSYLARNKPNAVHYWLNKLGREYTIEETPNDNDVVIIVDPDQVFLNGHLNVSEVHHGHGIAAGYGLGDGWVKNWKHLCNGACDEEPYDYNPSWGVPQMMTAYDTERHADSWLNVTNQMRIENHTGQETDMFAAVMAMRRENISMAVHQMMFSYPNSYLEGGWDLARWYSSSKPQPPLLVFHYCQRYSVASFNWTKKQPNMDQMQLQKCLPRNPLALFPSPDGQSLEEMERYRNKPLSPAPQMNWTWDQARIARHVYALDHSFFFIKQAATAYFDEFCTSG